MTKKPDSNNSLVQKELDKAEKQFEAFDNNIKEMTLDRMNEAAKKEQEPVTKLSQEDIEKSKEIYLKPHRQIASREKFNENFRKDYNYAMEYVRFIPEHREVIGEMIELWTKPFPGMPAQEWKIPTGKPVWAPRYVAEQISKCRYHRFVMQQTVSTGNDHMGQYYGSMAVDTTIQRLDAIPVNERKSIFMSKT